MDLLNNDKFGKSKKNNPTVGKVVKSKKSVLISHDLHRQLKEASLEHDMFIHEIVEEAFNEWRKNK